MKKKRLGIWKVKEGSWGDGCEPGGGDGGRGRGRLAGVACSWLSDSFFFKKLSCRFRFEIVCSVPVQVPVRNPQFWFLRPSEPAPNFKPYCLRPVPILTGFGPVLTRPVLGPNGPVASTSWMLVVQFVYCICCWIWKLNNILYCKGGCIGNIAFSFLLIKKFWVGRKTWVAAKFSNYLYF